MKYIYQIASTLEQLKVMDVKIDNAIQVGVLIESIDILELGLVTAAIKLSLIHI